MRERRKSGKFDGGRRKCAIVFKIQTQIVLGVRIMVSKTKIDSAWGQINLGKYLQPIVASFDRMTLEN